MPVANKILIEDFKTALAGSGIVAWNGSKVVEILKLKSFNKSTLIQALSHYNSAGNFAFAPANKQIPIGKTIDFVPQPNQVFAQPKHSINSPPSPEREQNYLRLTQSSFRDQYGCYVLHLDYFKEGKLQDRLEVCSGTPSRQFFRTAAQSRAMTGEPLPEGKWYIRNIVWCDGKDNYEGNTFSSGIGPVTVPLDFLEPGTTERSAIEIHIDWNRQYGSPGTVGCIGVYDTNSFKKFVRWLRDTNPRHLYVDWKLGTCPQP
ncbi:MAG: murein L,D-transpeptidase [Okeania sp. SIO3B5]|uniref:hypothetical protein n=1 Tax=Okeania sp. SIO3B5 TaxID=2607811 RepID=UPI001400C8B2|nr:hypothetical protein [Okeania sp. SIO3B5]NEO57025.1 murein L,D-transpeptidase [Okeania sp. SIO3B5]